MRELSLKKCSPVSTGFIVTHLNLQLLLAICCEPDWLTKKLNVKISTTPSIADYDLDCFWQIACFSVTFNKLPSIMHSLRLISEGTDCENNDDHDGNDDADDNY